MAINIARREGVNRTAQQLHLDAGKLKRLLVAAERGHCKGQRQPGFVELITPVPVAGPGCIIEFESAGGSFRAANTWNKRETIWFTPPCELLLLLYGSRHHNAFSNTFETKTAFETRDSDDGFRGIGLRSILTFHQLCGRSGSRLMAAPSGQTSTPIATVAARVEAGTLAS
jgi:hypothetical protein